MDVYKIEIKKGEEIVGELHWVYSSIPGGTVEILYIQVKEKYWRQGYGTKMLNKLIKTIKKRDVEVKTIYTITRKSNYDAQKFYEARDFRKIADLADFYKDGEKDAIMYVRKI